MNTPQPLQLPTHEEIEDARLEARIEAREQFDDEKIYEMAVSYDRYEIDGGE